LYNARRERRIIRLREQLAVYGASFYITLKKWLVLDGYRWSEQCVVDLAQCVSERDSVHQARIDENGRKTDVRKLLLRCANLSVVKVDSKDKMVGNLEWNLSAGGI